MKRFEVEQKTRSINPRHNKKGKMPSYVLDEWQKTETNTLLLIESGLKRGD